MPRREPPVSPRRGGNDIMTTQVLVVEDDLEINELIGEYLALENISYLQATTGQAGIHQAIASHPDAVILDLMLPDIDGFEVARTLSTHRATYDIPIIILSCMCQDCDRENGYSAGALFYMNKPFLPDDLLDTVAHALEWKAALHTRVPVGEVQLSCPELSACSKSINQMIADLFARTDLSDAAVAQIREAIDTLSQWARQWNAQHPQASHLKLDYRITPSTLGTALPGSAASASGPASIEWELTEDVPGLLADAFFRPAPAASGGITGGGLIGWGASTLVSKPLAPIAPPAQWLQVLAKTGAARFEKNSKNNVVRFSRNAGPVNALYTANSTNAVVPVVEIDGIRTPNRLRAEALAAKRK